MTAKVWKAATGHVVEKVGAKKGSNLLFPGSLEHQIIIYSDGVLLDR